MFSEIYAKMAQNLNNSLSNEEKKEVRRIKGVIKSLDETDLTEIKSVGEETAKKLFEHGIYSKKDLLKNKDIISSITLPLLGKKGIEKFISENTSIKQK